MPPSHFRECYIAASVTPRLGRLFLFSITLDLTAPRFRFGSALWGLGCIQQLQTLQLFKRKPAALGDAATHPWHDMRNDYPNSHE